MSFHLGGALRRLRGTAPEMSAACAILDARNEQTLSWQREVTCVAAPTGSESRRAEWMASAFHSVGWRDQTIDAAGNLIVRRGGEPSVNGTERERGAVWCCAHLDTVFDDAIPKVTTSGARVSGPGISDNGRGLAALLALADAIHTSGLPLSRELVFVCTVGEEGRGDLRGMKQLMRDMQVPPAAVIAIDGVGDDRIVTTALGASRWRITCAGPGGHSWADFGVVNPVQAIGAITSALHAIPLPRSPRTTLSVTRIGGGESINSIPRSAWLEVDIRSLSEAVLTDLARALRDAVQRVERQLNGQRVGGDSLLSCSITQCGARPGGSLHEDAPLVQIAKQATRAAGVFPRLATGSTDASVPISLGIPAIAIGAGGSGGGTHTPDEWYEDVHGVRGLQRALRIIAGAAALR